VSRVAIKAVVLDEKVRPHTADPQPGARGAIGVRVDAKVLMRARVRHHVSDGRVVVARAGRADGRRQRPAGRREISRIAPAAQPGQAGHQQSHDARCLGEDVHAQGKTAAARHWTCSTRPFARPSPAARTAPAIQRQGTRQAPRSSFFKSVSKLAALAAAQTSLVEPEYSIPNTGLERAMNGVSRSHSRYTWHCSLIAKSKASTSAATWDRSFLRPTLRPRAWPSVARNSL